MREIKFRAWNKIVKKFTYFGTDEPSIEYNADDKVGMFLEATNNVYISAYEEPQQYTGLKDSEGKEIYEGDIIKRTSMAPGGNDFTGEVKYVECSFWIEKHTRAMPLFDEVDCLEVIGNIYNNPQLLNV